MTLSQPEECHQQGMFFSRSSCAFSIRFPPLWLSGQSLGGGRGGLKGVRHRGLLGGLETFVQGTETSAPPSPPASHTHTMTRLHSPAELCASPPASHPAAAHPPCSPPLPAFHPQQRWGTWPEREQVSQQRSPGEGSQISESPAERILGWRICKPPPPWNWFLSEPKRV